MGDGEGTGEASRSATGVAVGVGEGPEKGQQAASKVAAGRALSSNRREIRLPPGLSGISGYLSSMAMARHQELSIRRTLKGRAMKKKTGWLMASRLSSHSMKVTPRLISTS